MATLIYLLYKLMEDFPPLFSLFYFSSFPLPWESLPRSELQAVLWKAPGSWCCQQIPALGIFRLRLADFLLWCSRQISAALVDVQSQGLIPGTAEQSWILCYSVTGVRGCHSGNNSSFLRGCGGSRGGCSSAASSAGQGWVFHGHGLAG